MVKYRLKISADMENIKKLQPAAGVDDPSFDYYLKCKFCEKVGTVTVITGKGKPLTQELSEQGKDTPLMELDCKGYEPVEFMYGGGWKAESISGTKFKDIDLSEGEFAEYDEKGECPVTIYNLRATFDVMMSDLHEMLLDYKIRRELWDAKERQARKEEKRGSCVDSS